jgi:hypothetical protein
MENRTFSGASLEEALQGDLFSHAEIVRIGMVKPSKTPGYISFTGGSCENWIEIPTSLIERAEQLGNRPCKDHSHPVFRLTLAMPDDPQAQLFAALLAQSPDSSTVNMMPQAQTPMGAMPQMQSGVPSAPQASGGYQTTTMLGGSGQPGASFQGPQSSARINTGGLGGLGGGLGAWGCWDSTCTTCTLWEYVCNGTACWWICKLWYERPCERCIWPW